MINILAVFNRLTWEIDDTIRSYAIERKMVDVTDLYTELLDSFTEKCGKEIPGQTALERWDFSQNNLSLSEFIKLHSIALKKFPHAKQGEYFSQKPFIAPELPKSFSEIFSMKIES